MKIGNTLKRFAIYCLGLFIMALGVSISKASDLGVSPINSIPCVVSLITEVDLGICTTLIFSSFIMIQILIMRKEFNWFNLLQILCSSLFGIFVSVSSLLADIFLPVCTNYFMRIIYVVISIILVAVGILFYLNADILSLPAEGVMQAISHKSGFQLHTTKLLFDGSVVTVATILSLVFLEELNGVGEGTILATIGVGLFLKLFTSLWKEKLERFLA